METTTQPMVKAGELRIGNWVKEYGKPIKFSIADFHFLNDELNYPSRYEPIPLTPEILEKCKLENGYYNNIQVDGNHIGVIFPIIKDETKEDWELPDYKEGIYVYSGLGDPESYGFKAQIKYLHQLQNLYFALTGTELEINL